MDFSDLLSLIEMALEAFGLPLMLILLIHVLVKKRYLNRPFKFVGVATAVGSSLCAAFYFIEAYRYYHSPSLSWMATVLGSNEVLLMLDLYLNFLTITVVPCGFLGLMAHILTKPRLEPADFAKAPLAEPGKIVFKLGPNRRIGIGLVEISTLVLLITLWVIWLPWIKTSYPFSYPAVAPLYN